MAYCNIPDTWDPHGMLQWTIRFEEIIHRHAFPDFLIKFRMLLFSIFLFRFSLCPSHFVFFPRAKDNHNMLIDLTEPSGGMDMQEGRWFWTRFCFSFRSSLHTCRVV